MTTPKELMDLATGCHRSGNLQQAEALCRQILQADARHAGAHHLLGLTAHQAGNQANAVTLVRQAIDLDPRNADYLFNLGVIYMKLGQPAEAMASYRQALRLDPNRALAHINLGSLLMEQGQRAEATRCFDEAVRLSPGSAAAAYNLANALRDQGKLAEATKYYRQAIMNDPKHAGAHNNMGVIHKNQGQLAEAALRYRQALRVDPQHAGAHFNLGLVLVEQGQPTEAIECFRQALRINPSLADAHFHLGNVFGVQGHVREAAECYRQTLRINPSLTGAHYHLGIALTEQGQLAEAADCYRQVLRLDPNHAEAHQNLSFVLTQMGHLAEAEERNAEGLRLQPSHGPGLWQRGVLRLLKGEYEGGWKDYEKRWSLPNKTAPSFLRPRWDGAPLAGKTVLVHAEQGLGDTIQFARYLPLVKERGGTVLFQCQPELVRLCTGMAGVDQLVAFGAPLPPFDVQAPLLSLPGIFGTTLATIPAPVPYLRADPARVEHWKKELAPLSGLKVGIAWQGNPKNPADRLRSVPLAKFETLARIEGVRLISVQKKSGTDQIAGLAGRFDVLDLSGRLDNEGAFTDTAAVLMNLDLVLTVESAVAHLAGALGVKVWALLTLVPDWRWLLDRTDSPWYPTMRLFRQRRLGDWDDVMKRVKESIVR